MGAITWAALLSLSSDPVLLLLLLAIFLFSSFFYVKAAAWSSHGGRPLPPGSFGLPWGLGENLQFLMGNNCPMGTPRPFLSSRLNKYGTIFKTHLLGHPTVVSMDANFNKLLLSNEGRLVQAAYPNFMKNILGQDIDLLGKRHHQMRELMRSSMSATSIQARHFIPIQEYACNILHSWSKMVVLDAQQESKKFVFNYVFKFLLNLEPEDPRTLSLIHNYEILLRFQSAVPLDIPGTTYSKALKARKRISTTIDKLMNARSKAMGEESKDLLDVLIKEARKYDTCLNEEGIIDVLIGFVVASLDTTSTLLTNVIKFLIENPEVADELQKEHTFIRTSKKENELLDWEDFKQMQFTKIVIKETLRVTNIAEFVPRKALQDIVIKDMVIPKGWRILINFSMLHLNPSNYENPLKFNPWRWQDTKINNQVFFMPFSGGIRTCVGSIFAEVEVSIFIHYLMTRYKWHGLMDTNEKVDVVSGHFVAAMKKGLPIKVVAL